MTVTRVIATLVMSVAVIALVAAIYVSGTQVKPILNTQSIGPCAPGFDVDAHPEVICYPVASPSSPAP